MNTIEVRFIDNQGGGYVDNMTVRLGTTVAEVFAQKKGTECDPSKFNIRLNNVECFAKDALKQGDMISVTPIDLKAFGK